MKTLYTIFSLLFYLRLVFLLQMGLNILLFFTRVKIWLGSIFVVVFCLAATIVYTHLDIQLFYAKNSQIRCATPAIGLFLARIIFSLISLTILQIVYAQIIRKKRHI
ncbi:MAG: hypothetical protein JW827_10490 [Spirochaetes bacterium]|nr:hypothetical protein [Spirochaetota bacterium]